MLTLTFKFNCCIIMLPEKILVRSIVRMRFFQIKRTFKYVALTGKKPHMWLFFYGKIIFKSTNFDNSFDILWELFMDFLLIVPANKSAAWITKLLPEF